MKRILPLLLASVFAALRAQAAGTWTVTAITDNAPPVLVSAAGGNLVRFAQTQISATLNGNWNALWLANGMHEQWSAICQMRTGNSATFTLPAEARLDEVRFHTHWDSGRNDFGFESVDVCDANGDWTSLANSPLALASTDNKGNTYVFKDEGGDALATGVTAVRIVLGSVENGWGGVSEIELLGEFAGTRTVTFCDADGNPLPGVAVQTVPTGGAATEPDASLVPQRSGNLLFAGWNADIYAVCTNASPRPVYNRYGVQYSRNAVWTDTPLTAATAALTGERNLARLPTTVLSTGVGMSYTVNNYASVTNGAFDYGSAYASDHDVVTFDFGAEANVDEVRVFTCWRDNGRSDAGIAAVRARDAGGAWTTLEGSLLPYQVSGGNVYGHRLSFSDPDGVPFARRVTALEVEFGATENYGVGVPEIEVFGEFYVPPPGTVIVVR